MEHSPIRVAAQIYFLPTEKGGRSSPLEGRSSYRPNHNFSASDNRDMCIGFLELDQGERVFPGDTTKKIVTLWTSPAVAPEIRVGREWRIQEGAKLVATGTILEVLGPLC